MLARCATMPTSFAAAGASAVASTRAREAAKMRGMTILRSAVVALVGLAAACGGATPPPVQPSSTPPTTAAVPAQRPTVVGKWLEFWGKPGETDVAYHDQYQVGYDGDKPFVRPLDQAHADVINSVTIDGDNVDLIIRTSFEVHYQLHLDPGGDSMTGTATTPDRTLPIRWERIRD